MKLPVVVAALIGGLIGSAITYSVSKKVESSVPPKNTPSESVQSPTAMRSSVDPFEGAKDDGKPILTDLTDLKQRDLVIAKWYMNEEQTMNCLKAHTGHAFGPVWNRRTPVEILEEQLAFWKEYLAESKRLELLQQSK